MSNAKNGGSMGSVAFYEDRGFLGGYTRDLPHDVSEPLAKAIYAIGDVADLETSAKDTNPAASWVIGAGHHIQWHFGFMGG